jgi:hypothetical protein
MDFLFPNSLGFGTLGHLRRCGSLLLHYTRVLLGTFKKGKMRKRRKF